MISRIMLILSLKLPQGSTIGAKLGAKLRLKIIIFLADRNVTKDKTGIKKESN